MELRHFKASVLIDPKLWFMVWRVFSGEHVSTSLEYVSTSLNNALKCVAVGFAGPYPQCMIDRSNEDLAIADLAGTRA
jgi:hypothetical protein